MSVGILEFWLPVRAAGERPLPGVPGLHENHVLPSNSCLFARMSMGRLLQPLLVYLSVATQFLKGENVSLIPMAVGVVSSLFGFRFPHAS